MPWWIYVLGVVALVIIAAPAFLPRFEGWQYGHGEEAEEGLSSE